MKESPPSPTPEQAIDPVEAVRKHVRRADGLRGLLANAAVKEATGSARLYSTLCAVIADLAVRLEQAERENAELVRRNGFQNQNIATLEESYYGLLRKNEEISAALSAATRTEQP